MRRIDSPALRGTWLGTLLRLWGPVMRVLLGSRLHWLLGRWFALLSWSGQRTGRVHTIPVSYVRDGRSVYLTTGDRWWHAVHGRDVRVRLDGRWKSGHATAVTRPSQSWNEHERLFRARPFFRRLAGIPGSPSGGADPGALERAIDAGRTLIRIELT